MKDEKRMVSRENVQRAYDKTCPEGRQMLEDIFPEWFGDEDVTHQVEFRIVDYDGKHYLQLFYQGKKIGFYSNGSKYMKDKVGLDILTECRDIFYIRKTAWHGIQIMRKS
jgi:hypothetical protein